MLFEGCEGLSKQRLATLLDDCEVGEGAIVAAGALVLQGTKILDPRDTYGCACEWEAKAKDLAARFIKNFQKFTGNEAGKALVSAGPQL